KKISVAGGPAQTLCNAPSSYGGGRNLGGTIVFWKSSRLLPGLAGGGGPIKTIEGRGGNGDPPFLPEWRRFFYGVSNSNESGIYLGSLDAKPGSRGRHITMDVSNPQYLPPSEGSPHGYILFVREQTLMAQPVDPNSLQTAGDVFPVIEQVPSLVGSNF